MYIFATSTLPSFCRPKGGGGGLTSGLDFVSAIDLASAIGRGPCTSIRNAALVLEWQNIPFRENACSLKLE